MTRVTFNLSTGEQVIDDSYQPPEEVDNSVLAPIQPHLNGGGLIRFATFPVAVAEAIKMIGAQRVAKGRYRALHETTMPTDQYAVNTSLMDTRPLVARVTARTDTFTEVRVTDLTGAAQDPTELTIETKRVIY